MPSNIDLWQRIQAFALAWLIARSLRRNHRDDAGKDRSIGGRGGGYGSGYWGCQG